MTLTNSKGLLLASAALHAVGCSASHDHSAKRPNIILLMADDLGWGDVGFNGNSVIQTPYMDTLANEGVTFDRFYSACAVSSPTRSSMLTGRNPYRTGIFTANEGIMRTEELSLPRILQGEGYATGHFGKWHLGTLTDQQKDANRGQVGNTAELNPPRLHGYDDSFTTESKVPTYDPMIRPKGRRAGFWDACKAGDEVIEYGTAYWLHDGKKATENLEGDDSRIIMDRVLPFIDQAIDAGKPFLGVVWFHAPHTPCVAGPEELALYSDLPVNERNYYGCITAMDKQIGRLVEHLKQAGQYDDTLIIFCSDNGPEGLHGRAPGHTGGLSGRKRSLLEGGIRVPAFAIWPNGFEGGGSRIDAPLFTSDYLPTIASILGLDPQRITQGRALDGENILALLRRESTQRKNPMVFTYDKQAAVIDNRYKLYFNEGEYALYDIVNDRTEQHNIISQNERLAKSYQRVLQEHLTSFCDSFSGVEYPFEDRLKQGWEDPLSKSKQ